VGTTIISTTLLNRGGRGVRSPADALGMRPDRLPARHAQAGLRLKQDEADAAAVFVIGAFLALVFLSNGNYRIISSNVNRLQQS
jgi:hypothetical protein